MSELAEDVLRSLSSGDLKSRKKKLGEVADYLQRKMAAGALHQSCQKQITVQALSALLTQFQQFLEDNFGRYSTASDNREFTKLPSAIFQDFTEGGSVCCVLETCLQEKARCGWAAVDFEQARGSSLQIERQYSQLLRSIENNLVARGFLAWPKVHLAASLVAVLTTEQVHALERIVTSHRGVVVPWEQATHIIEPDSAAVTKRVGAPLCARVVTSDETNRTQLHWWYYPDSLDQWVAAGDIVGELKQPEPLSASRPWRLGERWLHDTDLFNEWMNELDYLLEPEAHLMSQRQPVSLVALAGKLVAVRVKATSDANEVLGGETASAPESAVTERKIKIVMEDPRKTKKARVADTMKVAAMNISKLPGQPVEKSTVEVEEGDPAFAAAFANVSQPLVTENYAFFPYSGPDRNESRWQPPFPVVVPDIAAWFDLDSIHENETRAFPELTSKSAKKSYKEARDCVVQHYRSDPKCYLSAATATELVQGDAAGVFRIHAFLEQWGLINYGVTPDCDPLGNPTVNVATLYPIYSLQPECGLEKPKKPQDPTDPLPTLLDLSRPSRQQLQLRKFAVLGWPPSDDPLVEHARLANGNQFRCATCDKRCDVLRYFCRQRKDFTVCPQCFAQGQYPEILTDRDFVRVTEDPQEPSSAVPSWSNDEIRKLLEGLSRFEEDWDRVAAHVGSKSKDQCVLAFLQMPIEEPILNQAHSFFGVGASPAAPPLIVASNDHSVLPFAPSSEGSCAFDSLLLAPLPTLLATPSLPFPASLSPQLSSQSSFFASPLTLSSSSSSSSSATTTTTTITATTATTTATANTSASATTTTTTTATPSLLPVTPILNITPPIPTVSAALASSSSLSSPLKPSRSSSCSSSPLKRSCSSSQSSNPVGRPKLSAPSPFQGAATGLPFASHPNPVMALVSYLAAYVSPSIAAAAAQASMHAMATQVESLEREQNASNGHGEITLRGSARAASRSPPSDLKAAAELGLVAAANRARALAQEEEIKAIRCTTDLVKAQLKKIELKLDMLEGLERSAVENNNKLVFSYQQMVAQKQHLLSRLAPLAHLGRNEAWMHNSSN